VRDVAVDVRRGSPIFGKSGDRLGDQKLDRVGPRRCRPRGVHLTAGATSWHGFATAILEGMKNRHLRVKTERIIAIRTEDYPGKAGRPRNSRLGLGRLGENFGIVTPMWSDALERELDRLASRLRAAISMPLPLIAGQSPRCNGQAENIDITGRYFILDGQRSHPASDSCRAEWRGSRASGAVARRRPPQCGGVAAGAARSRVPKARSGTRRRLSPERRLAVT